MEKYYTCTKCETIHIGTEQPKCCRECNNKTLTVGIEIVTNESLLAPLMSRKDKRSK